MRKILNMTKVKLQHSNKEKSSYNMSIDGHSQSLKGPPSVSQNKLKRIKGEQSATLVPPNQRQPQKPYDVCTVIKTLAFDVALLAR